MKKIKNLSEGAFLKLLFGFLSACFLIAAVCMPDRGTMFTGLWKRAFQFRDKLPLRSKFEERQPLKTIF